MAHHDMTEISETTRPRPRSRRWRRLSRRVLFPVALSCLLLALALAGFARLAGSQASESQPFLWSGQTVYLAGSSTSGVYTTCDITPKAGPARQVEIPGDSGGTQLEPWFKGEAEISCGRSVSVTTGWQSALYPIAFSRTLILGLAASTALAWWLGRGAAAR